MQIGEAIRQAAEREGLGLEAFRRKRRLPNSGFWFLLRGKLPAKVTTRALWRKRLERAGVEVNGNL